MKYCSDIVVDLLKALEIEYVTFNPGSSFRGIHDSLVNYGEGAPEILLCCHEEVGIAIAQGYAIAAGKPMASLVHDLVGLQHASMAIYNAWCDRVPMLILGGGGPMDVTKRRTSVIWNHTALVQGNLVRDYVKWDDQPYGSSSVVESILRGYRLSVSKPQGPVYICLDSDWQESPLEAGFDMPALAGPPVSSVPAPEQGALENVGRLLAAAEFPLIIAGRYGPDEKAVDALVELADLISTPVIDLGRRFNFPNTHPLDVTGAEEALIPKADLILFLEVEDPFGCIHRTARTGEPIIQSLASPGTKLVDISLRDLTARGWSSAYQRWLPVDAGITGDGCTAVKGLLAFFKSGKGKTDREVLKKRRDRLEAKHARLKKLWHGQAAALSEAMPIATEWLAYVLGEVVKNEDWVLGAGSLRGWPRRLWKWDRSYRWIGESGGEGLGQGLGAAIGVALANRGKNRLVLDIQPDGDFLMTPQALWTAARCRIPLLIVMYNNRSYFNSENHAANIAKERGRREETRFVGTSLDVPAVDYAAMARSYGMYSEGPVERPGDVYAALNRAVQSIKRTGLPALVDVVCAKTGRR